MTSVKFFRSDMENAPSLTGQGGSINSVLLSCLVTGFNTKNVTGLTRSGSTVTVQIAGGHGFQIGDVLEVSGATPSDYNGQWKVKTRSTTEFTFDITGTPTSPASGTIVCKYAGAGWTRPFNNSTVSVFKPGALNAGDFYYRVDDAELNYVNGYNLRAALVEIYDSMTDVNTGVKSLSSGMNLHIPRQQINQTIGHTMNWLVVADDRTAHIFIGVFSNQVSTIGQPGPYWWKDVYSHYLIGDFSPMVSADVMKGMVKARRNQDVNSAGVWPTENYRSFYSTAITRTNPSTDGWSNFLAKPVSGYGAALADHQCYYTTPSDQYLGNGLQYPNPADLGLHLGPVWLVQERLPRCMRGLMRGLYSPFAAPVVPGYRVVGGFEFGDGTTRRMMVIAGDSSGSPSTAPSFGSLMNSAVAIDLDGPWNVL